MPPRKPTPSYRGARDDSPPPSAPRRVYEAAFKLAVVRHALTLPANARIKPIARCYPGVTPVQVRKWIRDAAALANAAPTAKLITRASKQLAASSASSAREQENPELDAAPHHPHASSAPPRKAHPESSGPAISLASLAGAQFCASSMATGHEMAFAASHNDPFVGLRPPPTVMSLPPPRHLPPHLPQHYVLNSHVPPPHHLPPYHMPPQGLPLSAVPADAMPAGSGAGMWWLVHAAPDSVCPPLPAPTPAAAHVPPRVLAPMQLVPEATDCRQDDGAVSANSSLHGGGKFAAALDLLSFCRSSTSE